MKKTIWKWRLERKTIIDMPLGAKPLAVQVQDGEPHLWALVDSEVEHKQSRTFSVYGTGHDLPDEPGTYIGTFQMADGLLVFHVFENTNTTTQEGKTT